MMAVCSGNKVWNLVRNAAGSRAFFSKTPLLENWKVHNFINFLLFFKILFIIYFFQILSHFYDNFGKIIFSSLYHLRIYKWSISSLVKINHMKILKWPQSWYCEAFKWTFSKLKTTNQFVKLNQEKSAWSCEALSWQFLCLMVRKINKLFFSGDWWLEAGIFAQTFIDNYIGFDSEGMLS